MLNKPQSEFARIAQIAEILGNPSSRVITGIGDDAAIVQPPHHKMLVCSDSMVEGIDFDLRYTSAIDLGHKSLASTLSDLAAMNGRAMYALISLALPKNLSPDFLENFYRSVAKTAARYSVEIVGGDLSSSQKDIFIDVVCIGETEHPILRSGAKVGDIVAVSGALGTSAAGLHALQSKMSVSGIDPVLREAHLRPHPRFDALESLRTAQCTSLIDISDGLASELAHLALKSHVGFSIEREKIPIDAATLAYAKTVGIDVLTWALDGGEDYELLATFTGVCPTGFTAIGHVTPAAQSLVLVHQDGTQVQLEAHGFDHFS